MRKLSKNPKLSIVILSYNTRNLLKDCLVSLNKVKGEVAFEIIVSDNGSSDGSLEMIRQEYPDVFVIENKKNLGFAAGNNKARSYVRGKYILFLNSDTTMKRNTLGECLSFLQKNQKVGAMTCKIQLPSGELDKDARRTFISPWIGLTHLILRLDRVFPKSKLFSKYWYGYIPPQTIHEVDALQGAFFLTRKKVLDDVGWFDEDYFLDGEDIDLSWRIKQKGWKIVYYPKVSIIHIKGASKGKNNSIKKEISISEKLKYRMAGVNSMEMFYRKHLWGKYPFWTNITVLMGIKCMKLIRYLKTIILG